MSKDQVYLTALSSLAKQPPDQNSKSRAVFVLKLLSMLFTTLDIARRDNDQPESEAGVTMVDPGSGQTIQQPVLLILKQLLPVDQDLTSTYTGDGEVSEAVCSNLKQGVSTLQDEIRPLTSPVLILADKLLGRAPARSVRSCQAVLYHVRAGWWSRSAPR